MYSPAPLHIPDGFLTIMVISLVFWAATIFMVGLAISKTNKILGEKADPLDGGDGGLHLCRPDAQLPGGRRHFRALPRRRFGRHRAGPLGWHPGDDGGGLRAGLAVPGRRFAGDGRQYLQYGYPDRGDWLRPVPLVANGDRRAYVWLWPAQQPGWRRWPPPC